MNRAIKPLWLLVFAGSISFQPSFASARNCHYFYVGGDIGILTVDFDTRYLDQSDAIPQNIQQTLTQHGYSLGLLAGYHYQISSRYFTRVELAGQLDSHQATFQSGASTAAFSDQLQLKNHLDISLAPGIMLSESLLTYIKFGISFANMDNSLESPSGFLPVIVSESNTKTLTGLLLGLGIAKNLNDSVAIFTEAHYRDYGSYNLPSFQNFSATYTHNTHVYHYDVTLGITYRL